MLNMKASRADVIEIGFWTRSTLEYIKKHYSTWWCSDLGGACGVGAFISQRLLKHVLGMSSTLVMGEEEDTAHCWIELIVDDTPHVLDVTATQFGKQLPEVYLTSREKYYQNYFVSVLNSFHYDDRALRMFHRWPDCQRPMTWTHEMAAVLPGLL